MPEQDVQDEEKLLCFVISPIGEQNSDTRKHADMVLNVAIRPALHEKYDVRRVDEFPNAGMISTGIINSIHDSALCVVDLSFLNPNVMYELGVRHTLQKSTIVVAVEGTGLPFDTAGHNTLFYDVTDFHSLVQLRSQIEAQSVETEKADFVPSNPISQALGHKALALRADSEGQILTRLSETVASLEGQFERFERRLQSPQDRKKSNVPASAAASENVAKLLGAAGLGSKVSASVTAQELVKQALSGGPNQGFGSNISDAISGLGQQDAVSAAIKQLVERKSV